MPTPLLFISLGSGDLRNLKFSVCPLSCQILHALSILRPIVKCRRVKIRPVRPNQGMNLWINLHLIEKILVLQWPEQFTCQNRAKIDDLLFAISKQHPQGVGATIV